jgi:adhesin/invasin
VTLFGTGLSEAEGIVAASSVPLPTTLAGTSVWFGSKPAPILAAAKVNGQEQLNVQAPAQSGQDEPPYLSPLIRIRRGRTLGLVFSDPYPVSLSAGIFVDAEGRPAVTHADFSLITASTPARPGETIVIFATGLGSAYPPVSDGYPAPASPLSQTSVVPQVSIGGQQVQVLFSGLTPGFVGVYQINVVVPALPAGEATLTVGFSSVFYSKAQIAIGVH